MKLYELTFLIYPNASEDELGTTIQDLKTFISDSEGEVKAESQATAIRLDYPINGYQTAYMASLDIIFAPEKILSLIKFIEGQKAIINHILFKKTIRIETHRPVRIQEGIIEKAEEEIAKLEEEVPQETKKSKKVELENLDQKLDEILREE